MTTPIASSASSAALLQATRQRASAESAATRDEQAESSTSGVQVSFSDTLRERLKAARKVGSALRARMAQVQEARKEAARQRIEQLRERIRMLKMLAVGGLASKGMLREIQQLARELGQAASVLKEGSLSIASAAADSSGAEADAGAVVSGADESATDVSDGTQPNSSAEPDTEATATRRQSADTDEQAEASDNDVDAAVREAFAAAQSNRTDDSRQRRADGESVQRALRELKGLLAMVRGSLQSGDKASKRLVEDIQEQMASIEDMAGDMSAIGMLSLGGISISV
ncbi:hypothetical protein [Pseudomonas sp. LRF_L74]|uniref:hypothetical protein n=1 Tax=Pseudomonas sp. LRF_L74 TaxID=3369422 RepID=UPI003F5FA0F6